MGFKVTIVFRGPLPPCISFVYEAIKCFFLSARFAVSDNDNSGLEKAGDSQKNEVICSWFIVGPTHFVASENMIDDVSDFVNVRNALSNVQNNRYITLCTEQSVHE